MYIQNVHEDEIDVKQFPLCLHPDDREQCQQDFYAFLHEQKLINKQYRFRKRDTDTYYWGNVRGSFVKADEHVSFAYFTYTDIDEMKTTENALRESRMLYEHSIESLHLGVWTYDIRHHRIVMGKNPSTQALRKRFGWPEVFENAPESTFATVMERDLPAYRKMFEEIEAGHDASCEVWYSDASGLEPHCERESYHVVLDEAGDPAFAFGVGQNITADRKVQERYQREMEFLRDNNEENLIAKGHYNLSKNSVVEYENLDSSKAFAIMPGTLSYDDYTEQFIQQQFNEEDRTVIKDTLDRRNLIHRYQEGQMQTTLQYQKKFKDKDPIWVSKTVHTYMSPETNDLEMFSYTYDVTEYKLIELIMNLISIDAFDYIGMINAPKNTFELIKKADDITLLPIRVKIDCDELRQKVKEGYISQEELNRYDEVTSFEKVMKEMKKHDRYTATYLCNKNGKTLCKQLDFAWFDREDEVILVVRTDVTEAYTRERQYMDQLQSAILKAERANEEKSAFLSSMSHDMRTPLNGIISYTNFALRENNIDQKQDYLSKVAESGNLLLDLIDDTLELSRIESGKVMLEPEFFELNDLISTIVTSLRPAAEAKNIKMEIHLEHPEGLLLWGDRKKTQKILLNLLTNSVKYTHHDGMVELNVINDPAGHRREGFLFTVKDNGIGMSREFMSRMYEPFAQEKRSESAETPGTGLGLSIVKKYVDLMEGTIDVESAVHKGTTWTIFLPMTKAEEQEAVIEKKDTPEVSLQGKRVLLCEDNQMNTEIAVMLLKDKGIITDTAANGKEGVGRFEASAAGYYDAILMDIQMPVMNGNDAAKKIRSLARADAKQIPIIAMSADVFEESIQASKEAGMNGYITKPLDPEHMFKEMAKLIK